VASWRGAFGLGTRLAGALAARTGRTFVFGAAEIMMAKVGQLRRLPRLPRTFIVRPALRDDEPALSVFLGNSGKVARLMSSGDLGLLALSEGQIYAMEWARFGPAEYEWDARQLGAVFQLPPKYCWLHNGSGDTFGPWAMVLGRLPALLEERGVEVVCLQVSCDNAYSIQCHESLGFRRMGRVAALSIAERPLVWLHTKGKKCLRFREITIDLQRLIH
jgi:hypothetical protein